MRTRTELTSPPGYTPPSEDEAPADRERYVPGLSVPDEPPLPNPMRRRLLWSLGALLVAVAIVAAVRLVIGGQAFDPSLEGITPGESTPAPSDAGARAPGGQGAAGDSPVGGDAGRAGSHGEAASRADPSR